MAHAIVGNLCKELRDSLLLAARSESISPIPITDAPGNLGSLLVRHLDK